MMYTTYFNLAFIIVIAALTALSYYKGKRMLFSLIVSFYPAAALYASFPYKANFLLLSANSEQVFYSHAIIFAVFFAFSYFAVGKIVHSEGSHHGVAGFIEALLLSLSVVLLTVAACFHVLPSRDIYGLSTQIENFFTRDLGYFVSVLLPVAVVYWMRNRY